MARIIGIEGELKKKKKLLASIPKHEGNRCYCSVLLLRSAQSRLIYGFYVEMKLISGKRIFLCCVSDPFAINYSVFSVERLLKLRWKFQINK